LGAKIGNSFEILRISLLLNIFAAAI